MKLLQLGLKETEILNMEKGGELVQNEKIFIHWLFTLFWGNWKDFSHILTGFQSCEVDSTIVLNLEARK